MIESGLDISNVNTIIIEKPQLFGLSQLYQLRGRVGRSSRQAYAYLLLDDFKNISENSIQKLKIISKFKILVLDYLLLLVTLISEEEEISLVQNSQVILKK